MDRESDTEQLSTYIYMELNHFAVHLILTQHCKSTNLNKFFLKASKRSWTSHLLWNRGSGTRRDLRRTVIRTKQLQQKELHDQRQK